MSKKIPEKICLRPAKPEDARQIATLIDMAANGLEKWEWHSRLTPQLKAQGKQPLDIGMEDVLKPGHYNSYKNATVAEITQGKKVKLAGVSLNHIISRQTAAEREALSPVDRVFADLKHHAVGSFYIDILACFPEFRSRGLGSRLIQDAVEKAHAAGCQKICLLAFEENEAAVRLYERKGFQEIRKLPVARVPHMPYGGHVLLLSLNLDAQS